MSDVPAPWMSSERTSPEPPRQSEVPSTFLRRSEVPVFVLGAFWLAGSELIVAITFLFRSHCTFSCGSPRHYRTPNSAPSEDSTTPPLSRYAVRYVEGRLDALAHLIHQSHASGDVDFPADALVDTIRRTEFYTDLHELLTRPQSLDPLLNILSGGRESTSALPTHATRPSVTTFFQSPNWPNMVTVPKRSTTSPTCSFLTGWPTCSNLPRTRRKFCWIRPPSPCI